MTRKTKGRSGWHQATPKTAKFTCNYKGLAAHIKTVIFTMALWGLFPIAVADWLINLGGQRDA